MAYNAEYYRGQAARAQKEADAACLSNVRDRALRSVAAFEQMAKKVERVAKFRNEREPDQGAMSPTTGPDDRSPP